MNKNEMNEKVLSHYQECVNEIEDYFEYQYAGLEGEDIKEEVMGKIDGLSLKILKIVEGIEKDYIKIN
jgi:hypothetical protein